MMTYAEEVEVDLVDSGGQECRIVVDVQGRSSDRPRTNGLFSLLRSGYWELRNARANRNPAFSREPSRAARCGGGSSNPILCPHLLVRLSHSQTLGNRYVVGKCRLVKIHVWESEILIKKKTSHHHLKSNRREPRVTYFSDSLNCTLLYQKRDIILVITVINVMG